MTHPTMRRTYSRADWQAAQLDWQRGEYDPGFWAEWRKLAAGAGIIAAPQGSRWDSWGDEHPSERALIGRAIDESPSLLRSVLRSGRVHSWSQVVRSLLVARDSLGEAAVRREQAARTAMASYR